MGSFKFLCSFLQIKKFQSEKQLLNYFVSNKRMEIQLEFQGHLAENCCINSYLIQYFQYIEVFGLQFLFIILLNILTILFVISARLDSFAGSKILSITV